jgi:hypothetical protein
VQDGGFFSFRGRQFRVGKGLRGQPVAIRPLPAPGEYAVFFCHRELTRINLHGK